MSDISTMDCDQLCAYIDAVTKKAIQDAENLREDIQKAYAEKDEAQKTMLAASQKKDLKTYREAWIKYNMLCQYLQSAETKLDDLENGSLLRKEDADAIRMRMFNECNDITRESALQIDGYMGKMYESRDEALTAIGKRNKVLFALHNCTRPKNQYGVPESLRVYRDNVITPFLNVLNSLQDTQTGGFRVYVDHCKRSAGETEE